MSERPNNRRTLERRMFVTGLAGSVALPFARGAESPVSRSSTPEQTLGPFYPRNASERPAKSGADLLRVEGDRVLTKGVPIHFTGRVLDAKREAAADAFVEIWQCDANAVYHHPNGGAESERDPNFQGYGTARTDATGSFHFRTIRPVAYPGRTAHIHIRVRAANGRVLATQLYLPNEARNALDFLFSHLTPDEQAALTLHFGSPSPEAHPLAHATQQTARADVVLA